MNYFRISVAVQLASRPISIGTDKNSAFISDPLYSSFKKKPVRAFHKNAMKILLFIVFFFFSYRTLRCTRIAIHVHLFISLALNNFAWIIWYKTVVQDLSIVQQNGVSRSGTIKKKKRGGGVKNGFTYCQRVSFKQARTFIMRALIVKLYLFIFLSTAT